MVKKTIKFKGIEFEEVSKDEYFKTDWTQRLYVLDRGKCSFYTRIQKRCSKCGQVVKE